MIILAIESSASPVSAAIIKDGKIISSAFSDIKVTHSQTLMPIINNVITNAKLNFSDIDAFAVANGPGSFTGIRIGISAVKGLAFPENKPCIAVSTLLSMAKRFENYNGIISPVMDARCNQVYNALFKVECGKIKRLTPDRALLCSELTEELKEYDSPIVICGDGSDVFLPFVKDFNNIICPSAELKYQNATGVALMAYEAEKEKDWLEPAELLPVYLRLPQAERELKEKLKKDGLK